MKFAIALTLLLVCSAAAQETCKSCPVTDLDKQFPPNAPVSQKRQPLFTKGFVITHSLYLASTLTDATLSYRSESRGACVESGGFDDRRPSAAKMYGVDLAFFAGWTGFDLLMQHGHPPRWLPMQHFGAVAGTAEHIHGIIKWAQVCR